MTPAERSDDELLAATARDAEAFGVFYRRHGEAVFRYMLFRTRSADEASELAAEVFAAALESSGRFRRMDTPARAWLFGIAKPQAGRQPPSRPDRGPCTPPPGC